VQIGDQVGLRDAQHVVATFEIVSMVHESAAAERPFVELMRLDHRPHGAVKDDNAPGQ
jgi:hypothetical protein